jgi:riboflavin synthase
MFTGIITEIGRVRALDQAADLRIEIAAPGTAAELSIGASVACSGVCLTVIAHDAGGFAVQASAETLARTTIAGWRVGSPVNLERALKVGDELGGHFVFGHVDGIARVVSITTDGASRRFVFEAPPSLARFIASKGSIALDGVSLTVNETDRARFGVNLIPHTLSATAFGEARPGDPVNLEIDMLARYVARLLAKG